MKLEKLAMRANEAKMGLEVARTHLEHAAHRWAEHRGPRALRDLHVAAENFDAAERAVEATARAWARAVGSAGSPLRDPAIRGDGAHVD